MDWLGPWQSIAGERPGAAETFENVLYDEVGHGHPLCNVTVEAIGRRGDADDVLFRLADGSDRVAVVHLTWTRKRQQPPWPHTEIFASLEDWIERGMSRDHREYADEPAG